MNLKCLKNFNNLNSIKTFFKLHRHSEIKFQTKAIAMSSLVLIPSVLTVVYCFKSFDNHKMLDGYLLLLFLGCLLSMITTFLSGIVLPASLAKMIDLILNNFKKDDFYIEYENLNHIDSYIETKSVINLILSTSLMLEYNQLIDIKTIQEVENALNYNKALLESMALKDLPEELTKKYHNNNHTIQKTLSLALFYIHHEKLLKSERFIKLLEATSIEDKIQYLKKHEALYQEQLEKQNEAEKSKEKLSLEAKKEHRLKIENLEKQILQKIGKTTLTEDVDVLKEKTQKKYLSL